jgi:hypothetical protein
MKKTIILAFGLLSISVFSQEKSLFSIQTGLLGVWINNEAKLADRWALRSELGLYGGIWGGASYDGANFALCPVLTVEPRYYYNYNKRQATGKDMADNSANFITLKIDYTPDWFIISNYDGKVSVTPSLAFIPKWGIRRNFGNSHFHYELGAGLGYVYYFEKNNGYGSAALDLHARIGYSF